MKQIIFTGYPTTMRTSIVTFSPTHQRMVKELKSYLQVNDKMSFSLGRITDTEISVGKEIQFFDIVSVDENTIKANYYGDHRGANEELIPMEKIIRLDNPFGEIPVLPGYEQLRKFFLVGEGFHPYNTFIAEVRETLINEIGNGVQLWYKNDDGSFSVIDGTLKEVNKGNIFMEDFYETLVRNNRPVSQEPLLRRKKNHRFISLKGYLCGACSSTLPMDDSRLIDDGKVFGQEATWDFTISEIVA